MASDEVRVEAAALEAFTRDVFIRVGMPSEDATVEAEVLVWANLRGVDSQHRIGEVGTALHARNHSRGKP